MYKQKAEDLPLKHVGTPDEIAEAYLFSMKCTYLTGQTIYVDGGYLL
jgi:NAD(P)-dependent dehydrogenase (short-subunit alcohol dehydrogenase family)